jgi:hypothetical protein
MVDGYGYQMRGPARGADSSICEGNDLSMHSADPISVIVDKDTIKYLPMIVNVRERKTNLIPDLSGRAIHDNLLHEVSASGTTY